MLQEIFQTSYSLIILGKKSKKISVATYCMKKITEDVQVGVFMEIGLSPYIGVYGVWMVRLKEA
jgi:hypothetical protein